MQLIDFMPIHRRQAGRRGYDVGTSRRILRLVLGLGGQAEMEVSFRPTFDYARDKTDISVFSEGAVASVGRRHLVLSCPGLDLEPDGRGGVRGRLSVGPEERRWVALTEADDPDDVREALAPRRWDDHLARTRECWESWAATCSYRGPYRNQVLRSALMLKLLTHEPSGAAVAEATTSLPEEISGVRNWDYRYSWLRDSSLILYTLMTIGYQAEAADFFHWLDRTQRSDPTALPQILYAIDGGRELPESTLDHLEGYRCSRPVRIGNGAAGQFQLDVFGEVLRAAYLHFLGDGGHREDGADDPSSKPRPSREPWRPLRGLVEQAAAHWREPFRGIWEIRGAPRLFLHSRLACWAALDLSMRLAREYRLPTPVERWSEIRDTVRQAIVTR